MVSDDYLGEIEQFLNAYREDGDDELIANPIAYHWLTVGALRAVAAELRQIRAKVAEFPELLADAQEMALDKLVEAFGEGYDNCRMRLDDEAQRGRDAVVGQYSNQLPWPAYAAAQQSDRDGSEVPS